MEATTDPTVERSRADTGPAKLAACGNAIRLPSAREEMSLAGPVEAGGPRVHTASTNPLTPASGFIARRSAWLRDLPARSALRVCNHPTIRALLGRRYANALEKHRNRLPALTGLDQVIVRAVEQEGVFVTSLEALGLPASEEILRTGQTLASRFSAEARRRAAEGEPFLYVPPEWIIEHPELFSWGLQDRLLDIAEAYIGLRPAYDGACINYTVADGREISTRKWHRDWEDRRMLKVCVYLHSVDAAGGPFQIVRRSDPMQNDLEGFVYDLAGDDDLERRLGRDFTRHKLSCEGLTGTVIFMDTARFFHRGKPATASDRAAIFYSYIAERPRHPFLCERSGMARGDIARLASALPERQRQAAQWRSRLPFLFRLIPPARL